MMGTNKEQSRVNTYFQDATIKNACELLAIEKRLQLDGLILPNNVIVNRNGISCAEFIQWYEKSQYPKTYEECAILLNTYCGSVGGYNWKLLSFFQHILVCLQPTAMDVYQGKTTLEYKVVDNVKVDSVVIFKKDAIELNICK